MTPIGKGSRFLVLSGDLRGREGTVTGPDINAPLGAQAWLLKFEGPNEGPWSTAALEGPAFKRLPDAPAEIDPLFAELAALEVIRLENEDEPGADDRRCPSELPALALDEIERADSIIGVEGPCSDAVYRDAMMHAAMYCLAAVRCIDRAHGR